MKTYNIKYNIGKAKYVINLYDGIKTHPDGTPFFDIHIIRSKKALDRAVNNLIKQGYVYE